MTLTRRPGEVERLIDVTKGEAMAAANARDGRGPSRIPWRAIGWSVPPLILLLPLVANAPWTLSDYIFAGVLMGLVGAGLEFAVRKGNPSYSMAAGVALAAIFLLLWISGAVGIIGSEQDDVNMLFLGVPAVALLGAIGALFRPTGMALAMAAAAIAQASVPVAGWVLWPASRGSIWQPEVVVLTGFFTVMWLLSAWLFRKAAD
jgi:hypothetical protein